MGKIKILLIDDEKDLVETLTFRLEANGYEVIKAYDGREALEKAGKERPNLILLDVMMPQIDGFEVLKRLKNNSETERIPVIMLTCKKESSSIFKGEDLGALDYIIKPFEAEELLRLIKKYI